MSLSLPLLPEKDGGDLSRRVGRYPFATDLLANVTGNAITGGLLWIGKTLLGK